MTAIECQFGGGKRKKPYHYTECGLDEVYLVGGYEEHETPYGKGVSVKNVDGLHRAIADWLVCEKKALSGSEIRFLRKQLDLSQSELADLLGTTSQTVARWEKAQFEIPGPADILLRLVYLQENYGKVDAELGLRLRELADSVEKVVFSSRGGKWHQLRKAA